MSKREQKKRDNLDKSPENKEIPQARPGIHDKHGKDPVDDNEEVLRQCDKCEKRFLVCGQNIQKLDENKLKKYEEIFNKKHGVYPDLAKEAPFTCTTCTSHELPLTSVPSRGIQLCGLNSPLINSIRGVKCNWVMFLVVSLVIGLWPTLSLSKYLLTKDYRIDDGKSVAVNHWDRSTLEEAFDNETFILELRYDQQEERTWDTLLAGVKAVLRENKPSVFLMLYLDDLGAKTSECIAKDMSKAVTKYLMRKQKQPLIYSGKDLNNAELNDEPGKLLEDRKSEIKEKGVMIITELQHVPANVAKILHFMCDRYSPLVDRAVYFFTLQVSDLPEKKEVLKFTEDSLRKLWSAFLEDSVLQPLITRLTGNVVKIYSQPSNC